ncbi:MAG: hypothetical protein JWN17_1168, partial [Frankiales bacterium]|nr:hypothetical protein [Frankiales bacterium]
LAGWGEEVDRSRRPRRSVDGVDTDGLVAPEPHAQRMTTTNTRPVLVLGEDAHVLREALRTCTWTQGWPGHTVMALDRRAHWSLDSALPPTEGARALRRCLVRLHLQPVYAQENSRILLTVLLLHVLETLETARCHDRH